MALKAKTVTREMVKILALGMEEGGEAAAKALPPVYAGDAPDAWKASVPFHLNKWHRHERETTSCR